jgi:Zn-dependent protease
MLFDERQGLELFKVRGISVSFTFWYAFIIVLIGFFMTTGDFPFKGIILVGAITASLLIHEFGHALVSQKFDLDPRIVLHGFGGACVHQPASTDENDALVILSGPIFGLAAAGLFLAILSGVSGSQLLLSLPEILQKSISLGLWYLVATGAIWNALNLFLPIWPLDGGKLFHLLLRQFHPSQRAQDIMLKTSVCCALAAGVAGVAMYASLYIAIFTIFVLMGNIRILKSGQPLVHRPQSEQKDEPNPFQENLLEKAEEAFSENNWQEAYRLGHQLRSSGSISGDVLRRVWEVLAVATTELEKYEEALKYIEQLPETSDEVERAKERCQQELTRGDGRRERGEA